MNFTIDHMVDWWEQDCQRVELGDLMDNLGIAYANTGERDVAIVCNHPDGSMKILAEVWHQVGKEQYQDAAAVAKRIIAALQTQGDLLAACEAFLAAAGEYDVSWSVPLLLAEEPTVRDLRVAIAKAQETTEGGDDGEL